MYYNGLKILSHNAIYNFVNTNRNFGKTWTFKYRAVKRALKKGKKTIWIRRFKKEAKECIKTFFKSNDLQKFCGLQVYDKEKKTGNFKQEGNTFFILRKGKWIDFLKIYALSDSNAMRSADDVDIDTIVFDEYTTTPDKYKRYRGDEVTDFIDLFISAKRKHKVICIFLGNKESELNPYLQYFNIKPLPVLFDGFKTYKKGSICVEQRNNETEEETEYDKQVNALLSGTKYGNYLNNQYKTFTKVKICKLPADANCICQICFNGYAFGIYALNEKYFISSKINKGNLIYCDVINNKYKNERQLIKPYKRYFNGIINAISDNRVYYESNLIYEQIQTFYKWLSFK